MKKIETKERLKVGMIYFSFIIFPFLFFACSDHENIPSESDQLSCKSVVEKYSLSSRALSDQIKDVNLYYLQLGQTTNYTTYPITLSGADWLGEYFLFETNKWRSEINCGLYADTVYYYMTATNETGNEEGPEPLHGVSAMNGEPLAEFYLRCRKSKLTTIVKMADGSDIDPSLLSLTLNVYPEEAATDFKAPAIMADKTQPMETHTLISPTAGAAVESMSKTLLLPEQIFEPTDSERPTMLLEYDDTKYHVYLDTIAIDRAVTNRYREKYNGHFALLHNEHITLTLSLTPIIELVTSVTLDDWITGKSFEPIAVDGI